MGHSPGWERKTIPLQNLSHEIWDKKYRLRTLAGEVIDESLDDTLKRVAIGVAVSESEDSRDAWASKFLWALRNGAIPAGRILTNVGINEGIETHSASTINCVVSEPLKDNLEDILDTIKNAGMTLKAGCGIGYDFSTIRPEGAMVLGNNTKAFGPLAVMEILDQLCMNLSTTGNRRGAQMAVLDIRHPDILNFVRAKHVKGRFRNFNMSVLVSDAFLDALRDKKSWDLVFPVRKERLRELEDNKIVWTTFPDTGECVQNEVGLTACEVINTVSAEELWDSIMQSTYDYSEPGVLFIDRINANNNNWFCEDIRATNPCGEQPLPPSGACLLGSVNLTHFIDDPFSKAARFDWNRFEKVVTVFVRFLDNVVELNGLPLGKQRDEILRKRRHGMGVLGLGSAVTMLCMRYGDDQSCTFTDQVMRRMALIGWRQSVVLAREKGPAPIMEEIFTLTQTHLLHCPELVESGYSIGDKVAGLNSP